MVIIPEFTVILRDGGDPDDMIRRALMNAYGRHDIMHATSFVKQYSDELRRLGHMP